MEKAKQLRNFFAQPMFSAAGFTNTPGKFVSLEDTISGCEMILNNHFLKVHEERFYMIGNISELKK